MDISEKRAAADALAHMIEEGVIETRKFYFASYAVHNVETNEVASGPLRVEALNYVEAVGRLYLEVRDKYGDGSWNPPDIHVDEEPIYGVVSLDGDE